MHIHHALQDLIPLKDVAAAFYQVSMRCPRVFNSRQVCLNVALKDPQELCFTRLHSLMVLAGDFVESWEEHGDGKC